MKASGIHLFSNIPRELNILNDGHAMNYRVLAEQKISMYIGK